MSLTGVFLLQPDSSTSAYQTICDRVIKKYKPEPLGPWRLEHRLFRATLAPAGSGDDDFRVKYLHILSLSHHKGRSYVNIVNVRSAPGASAGGRSVKREGTPSMAPTPSLSTSTDAPRISEEADHHAHNSKHSEPAAVIEIPSSQSEDFARLLVTKFGPLWTQRQSVQVVNGQAYDLGEYRIRIGELRQAGSGTARGVVVAFEIAEGSGKEAKESKKARSAKASANGWKGNDEEKEERQQQQQQQQHEKEHEEEQRRWEGIRHLWSDLEIEGAKAFIKTSGVGSGTGFEEVRQWCEALRLPG